MDSDNEQNIEKENREMIQSLKEKSDDDFEKNLVLITSGTLVLSMSFIEKIVPLTNATWLWTLICSWIALVTSLLLNLISHRLASRHSLKYIYDQAKGKPPEEINNSIKADNEKMNRINDWTVGLMILGIIFLIVYCSINAYKMSSAKKPSEVQSQNNIKQGEIFKGGRQSSLLVVPVEKPKPAPTVTNDKKKS